MSRVDFPLYLITDRHQTAGRPLLSVIEEAVRAGVSAVQLREKDLSTAALVQMATDLSALIRSSRSRFFINDRIDLVMALSADGVHLRASSLPVSVTRRMLPRHQLIGISVHGAEEAVRAEADGADFAVLGPVYETPSKLGYGPPLGVQELEVAARRTQIPIFAVGGITPDRAREVRRAGAYGVAVISSILTAPRIAQAAQDLLGAITGGVSPDR
jgi:thiamine-phosphate pyrophosphorylase